MPRLALGLFHQPETTLTDRMYGTGLSSTDKRMQRAAVNQGYMAGVMGKQPVMPGTVDAKMRPAAVEHDLTTAVTGGEQTVMPSVVDAKTQRERNACLTALAISRHGLNWTDKQIAEQEAGLRATWKTVDDSKIAMAMKRQRAEQERAESVAFDQEYRMSNRM